MTKRLISFFIVILMVSAPVLAKGPESLKDPKQLFNDGKYREAIKAWEARIEAGGESADAILGIGMAADKIKWFSKAAENLEKFVQEYPDRDEAEAARGLAARNYRAWGFLNYDEDKKDDARDKFKKAIKLDPDLTSAHYWLARVYDETRQFEAAALEWNEVLRLEPGNKEAQYWLKVNKGYQQYGDEIYRLYENAYRAYKNGNMNVALKLMQQAIEAEPGFAMAQYWAGRILFETRQWSEAAKYFETALELEPDNRAAAYFLSRARQNANPPQPAPPKSQE